MENIKLPAYPHQSWEEVSTEMGDNQIAHFTSDNKAGFTKLELAALMIAQGMLANSPDWSEKDTSINWVGINSVKYAKAILEEANK